MISSYTFAMLRVILTLFLLVRPNVSRPIPINVSDDKQQENLNNQRKNNLGGFYSALSSDDGHSSEPLNILVSDEKYQENVNNLRKNNGDEFYSTPSAGDGHFRDPLEILGPKFSKLRIMHLCKANVYMYADFVSDVTFPADATKLCRLVCKSYQELMYLDPGVTVSLVNSNCDYIGDTIIEERPANGTHEATCPDLSTSCVCTYNVRCNRKTKLVKYSLTPNENGNLKVSAADCNLAEYVT